MSASQPKSQAGSPFSTPVGQVAHGPVLTVRAEESASAAGARMTEASIGSLVVMENDAPTGMLTKTDLVAGVLGRNLAAATPVRELMSPLRHTLDAQRPLFDALLLMMRHNIGHVVVTDGGKLSGMVSERDWLEFQQHHPLAQLRGFATAESVETLAALRANALAALPGLFAEEGTAASLTALVTEINDRCVQRVIELALVAHGSPPAAFCWLALGSEGRAEQTLSTDQDNALVFQDVPDSETEAVRTAFLRLAERIVDGLDICGFPRCKGNVMGSNPDLCLPLLAWQRKFSAYLFEADAEALLRAAIYFDFRGIYGDLELARGLRTHLSGAMARERGFLRHLAGDLLNMQPPVMAVPWRLRAWLGLELPLLDLKRHALAPLVAAVRVAALACGAEHTNTLERIHACAEAGALPAKLAASTESAYGHLMLLRIRANFRQQSAGQPPSNLLRFSELDPLRQRFLREALETVSELQGWVFSQFGGVAPV